MSDAAPGGNSLSIYAEDNLNNGIWTLRQQINVWGPDMDTTPPVVTLISVSPTLIEPGDTVTVTWSATDSSGLDFYGGFPETKARLGGTLVCERYVTRISGTRYDGVYQAQMIMSDAAPGGNSLSIYAEDNLNNGIWTDFGQQINVWGPRYGYDSAGGDVDQYVTDVDRTG